MNLGYIASRLRMDHIDVDLLDIWGGGLDLGQVREVLAGKSYDAFGISAMSTQFNYVSGLTRAVRAVSDRPIVLGGPLATFSQAEVLSSMPVDVCVQGEGESTASELFPALAGGGDLSAIRGITYNCGDAVVATAPREQISDLDSLPLPAYDLFKMDTYVRNCSVYSKYGRYDPLPAINVVTGRGCPYQCHFCSKTMPGVRFRSIDNVADEIRHLKERFGIKGIFFNDETLVSSKKRVFELCEKIGPLGLRWNCQGRANVMDRPLLEEMRAAGCVSIGYGVESGSQAVLNAMNKHQDLGDVVNAVNLTTALGMEPIPQWMFGYPGENDETVAETRSTFARFDFPVNQPFICTPLPGTKLYDDTVRQGRIEDTVQYHRRLSDGYAPVGQVLVNFTRWADDELLRRKRMLERRVRISFMLRALIRPRLWPTFFRELGLTLRWRAKKAAGVFTSLMPRPTGAGSGTAGR